jgi:hypothetical protein
MIVLTAYVPDPVMSTVSPFERWTFHRTPVTS